MRVDGRRRWELQENRPDNNQSEEGKANRHHHQKKEIVLGARRQNKLQILDSVNGTE